MAAELLGALFARVQGAVWRWAGVPQACSQPSPVLATPHLPFRGGSSLTQQAGMMANVPRSQHSRLPHHTTRAHVPVCSMGGGGRGSCSVAGVGLVTSGQALTIHH